MAVHLEYERRVRFGKPLKLRALDRQELKVNKKQILILWSGISMVVLMLLIPPWKFTYRSGFGASMEYPGPYTILFSPPSVPVTETSETSDWQGFHGRGVDAWTAKINFTILGLQIAITLIIILGLLVTCKDRNPNEI